MQSAEENTNALCACPLDENFRAFIYDYVKEVAKCGVDIIQFDDDFRYGYIDAQIRNKHIYEDIQKYFDGKKICGVRVYEFLNKFENMDVPKHIKENENIYDTFFSPASRLCTFKAD